MNFNLAKILTLLTFLITFSVYAQEESSERAGTGTDTYGSAGCGLGAAIIGDKPGAIQIFASTSNFILFNQLFAISSGTSGCNIGRYQAMAFVDVNRVALAKDIVHGDGETLDSFAKLIGCPARDLGPELKKNYESVFSEKSDPARAGDAILHVIQAQPKLQACSAPTLG